MLPLSDVIPPRRTPAVTFTLIAVHAVMFAYGLALEADQRRELTRMFAAVPADLAWPAIFTSLFLHDGWILFGGNMISLWIFGQNVEDSIGAWGYWCFYFAAGGLAALVYAALHPGSTTPLLGAGSAVAAIMGAYFVLFPNSQVLTILFLPVSIRLVEVPAIFYLGVWFLLQVVGSLDPTAGPGGSVTIPLDAHLAGFGAGAVAGWVVKRRGRRW